MIWVAISLQMIHDSTKAIKIKISCCKHNYCWFETKKVQGPKNLNSMPGSNINFRLVVSMSSAYHNTLLKQPILVYAGDPGQQGAHIECTCIKCDRSTTAHWLHANTESSQLAQVNPTTCVHTYQHKSQVKADQGFGSWTNKYWTNKTDLVWGHTYCDTTYTYTCRDHTDGLVQDCGVLIALTINCNP